MCAQTLPGVCPDKLGGTVLAYTFLVFGILFPIGHIVLVLGMWLILANRGTHKWMCGITDVFGSWSALDVTCLNLVVCFLQVGSAAHHASYITPSMTIHSKKG